MYNYDNMDAETKANYDDIMSSMNDNIPENTEEAVEESGVTEEGVDVDL